MPNQLSDKTQRVTVALPKELVGKIDQIAHEEERSRSQVILRLLRDEIEYTKRAKEAAHPTVPLAAEDPATYPKANGDVPKAE